MALREASASHQRLLSVIPMDMSVCAQSAHRRILLWGSSPYWLSEGQLPGHARSSEARPWACGLCHSNLPSRHAAWQASCTWEISSTDVLGKTSFPGLQDKQLQPSIPFSAKDYQLASCNPWTHCRPWKTVRALDSLNPLLYSTTLCNNPNSVNPRADALRSLTKQNDHSTRQCLVLESNKETQL